MLADTLNLRQVVEQIHSRVRGESQGNTESLPDGATAARRFGSLRGSYDCLYQIRNSVGQMPPCPDTMRGRLGSYLVRVVQRALFWYTPQIVAVQEAITEVLGELIWALEEQSGAVGREGPRLEKPRHVPGGEVERVPAHSGVPPLTSHQFQFSLLKRFRGSEEDVKSKLKVYVAAIRTLSPPPPQGMWLDVGCGRGEWLALAREAGQEAMGIDSNPLLIAHCASLRLPAERGDALAYLAALPQESLALISAFHVLEHLPFHDSLACIEAAVRALKPGGLLILEMPNPANLTIGAHSFWNDPTHERPVPAQLAELVLEFCGLHLERRFDLNPSPTEEQLPFQEIYFVDRINQHLCGPRDYGILARK